MDRLDETDERILAELADHARATFAEIGQRVNLSAPAVKRRVDRMLDNGVIRGFTTVVDRNALGWTTEAYVQVFCHGTIAPDEPAVADPAATTPSGADGTSPAASPTPPADPATATAPAAETVDPAAAGGAAPAPTPPSG